MKTLLIFTLFLLPAISFSQLSNDGKSSGFVSNTGSTIRNNNNTIFYSAGLFTRPFGIKYQYCKSLGGYVSFKTDFGAINSNYIATLGISKSLSSKFNLYLGGGLDLFYESFVTEFGGIIKSGKLSYDIGYGLYFEDAGYMTNNLAGYLTLGVGINF